MRTGMFLCFFETLIIEPSVAGAIFSFHMYKAELAYSLMSTGTDVGS